MQTVRAALAYFAAVFAVGFALGCIRVPLLAQHLGERTAELVELPVMAAACVAIASWRQRRTPALPPRRQLLIGTAALALLLAAECALGALQGRPPAEVLFARDPVAGTAWAAALLVFALAPAAWALHRGRRAGVAA